MATGIASANWLHVGATPQWMLLSSTSGREDEDEADDDEQGLRREVDDCKQDVEAGCLLDADDVDGDEHDDDDRADDVRVLT